MTEHHNTNRVSASQRTTIRGAQVLRLVTQTMGFDHIPRRPFGEPLVPDPREVDDEIGRQLRAASS